MTAQISDFCKYDNETYNIIGKTDWFAFDPEACFGLKPGRASTAVGKGYWTGYEIRNRKLYVNILNIRTFDDVYPIINGVCAKEPGVTTYICEGKPINFPNNHGCWIYDGLEFEFDYSGRFLLGTDRLSGPKYSNPGGTDRYWKYKKLLSVQFEHGNLVEIEDVSKVGKTVFQKIYDLWDDEEEKKEIFYEFMLEEIAEKSLLENAWWIKRHK